MSTKNKSKTIKKITARSKAKLGQAIESLTDFRDGMEEFITFIKDDGIEGIPESLFYSAKLKLVTDSMSNRLKTFEAYLHMLDKAQPEILRVMDDLNKMTTEVIKLHINVDSIKEFTSDSLTVKIEDDPTYPALTSDDVLKAVREVFPLPAE